MIKKVQNKKNIVNILIIVFVLIICGTIAYFFNSIVFNKNVANKRKLIYCYQGKNLHEDLNLGCTNTMASVMPVVLRFKYDDYWEYTTSKYCNTHYVDGYYTEYDPDESYYPSVPVDPIVPLDPVNPTEDLLIAIAEENDLDYNYSFISHYNGEDETITFNWDENFSNNFVKGSDGWYYYKKVFNPGDTINILNSITNNYGELDDEEYHFNFYYEVLKIDEDLINELWNATYTIDSEENITWTF